MGFDCSIGLQFLAKLLIPLNLIGKATDYTNVFYKNDEGTTLHAYLALPPNFDASVRYPAAMIFHAWNGMSTEPVYFADLLALQGYIVIAPDLFRNVATIETNLPWNIANTLLTPQNRINNDIDTAIDYLTKTQNVDSSRIFSGPGFCFGGSQAITLSIRRPMAGTITLYGANVGDLQDGTQDKLWGNLGAGETSLLGIYGRDDMNPNVDAANGFQAALNFRGISNTITIYDGVGHAFVNPLDHSNNKEQAVQAWDQVVDWINDQANVVRGRRYDARLGVNDTTTTAAATAVVSSTTTSSYEYHQPTSRPAWSFAWIWGHVMDMVYGTGHFSHHHDVGFLRRSSSWHP